MDSSPSDYLAALGAYSIDSLLDIYGKWSDADPDTLGRSVAIHEIEAELARRGISKDEASAVGSIKLATNSREVCPPLTIQLGELGGLRLDDAQLVGNILTAIGLVLSKHGHPELAGHVRRVWTEALPLIKEEKSNG